MLIGDWRRGFKQGELHHTSRSFRNIDISEWHEHLPVEFDRNRQACHRSLLVPIFSDRHSTGYGVSTVAAITIGALRSGPFTNSTVLMTASGRFGSTFKYRICWPR